MATETATALTRKDVVGIQPLDASEIQLILDTAEELGIPLQISYVEGGGTDGGAIHIHKTGVPTIVLMVPARHIHSHSSMIHRDDYDNAVKLLVELILRLDAKTIASFTA